MFEINHPGDVTQILEQSRRFFAANRLNSLADALPESLELGAEAKAQVEKALGRGLTAGFLFPAPGTQLESIEAILDAMAARPSDELGEVEQYASPFSPEPEDMRESEVQNRPEAPYLLLMRPEGYPEETRGKTAPQIARLFEENEWQSLTAPEYLVLQRVAAEKHGDHRFDNYGKTVQDTQWMWLVDSRQGDKTFMSYWNPSKNRIELGYCKFGSKNPRKGAHPTVIVPV